MPDHDPQDKPLVMLCEDEPPILRVSEMKFSNAGFRVHTAMDGIEGWKRIVAETPDILISDIQMPNMDGLQLVRRLRAHEATRELPVLLLTAKGLELGHEEVEQLKVLGVLYKPFSPRELLETAEQILADSTYAPRSLQPLEIES